MPIQLPPDSTGKLIETVVVTSSEHREVVILGSTTLAYAPVTSSGGLLASLSSGTVSLSSQITVTATGPVTVTSGTVTLSSVHTVTATAATNPWSSAPGFNVPVVSVSSGLVQVSGTPLVNVVGTSSGVAVVTTSGGLVVQATGPFGTVTVLSVSSGLVQLTVPTLISLATTAAAPIAVLVTSSGGPVVSAGVNTAAGYGPVTSSAGRLCSLSSGTVIISSSGIVTVISASSATPALVRVTSSGAIAPTFVTATTISKLSSAAATLWSLSAVSSIQSNIIRLYNLSTSNVTMGTTTAVALFLVDGQATGTNSAFAAPHSWGPRGMSFLTACSFDVVITATSTAAVYGGNTFVTALIE